MMQIYFITTYTYKQQMGAGKSQENIYYDPTVNAQLFDETKQCKFYRNQKGEQFQKYRIRNSGNTDFENRYEYRIKHNSPYLVNAYSAKASQNPFGCTSADQYQVVTQRIPIRLCDINNMPGPQALNMVHKALKGFQQIYKSQGVLLVKDSMIGVNQQNNVKVWMNSNFAVNQVEQPPISYGVLSDYEKQSTLVDNIIQLVNSRSKRDNQWIGFVDEKYRQGRIGFDQAIQLSQIQAQRHNIILADNYNSNNPNMHQSPHNQLQFASNTHQYQINNPSLIQSQPQFINNFDPHTSMMKNTTQTIASSINLNPIPPAPLNVYTPLPIINKQLNQSIPNVRVQTGMSNIRNKIINKTSQVNQQNSYIVSATPLLTHQSLNSSFKTSNNVIQTPQIITPQPLQAQIIKNQPIQTPSIIQNRAPISSVSNQTINRPRPHSQGKPIITFGNRPYNPSPQNNIALNQKNPMISPQVPQVTQIQNHYKINDPAKNQPQAPTNQKNMNSKLVQGSTSNLNSFYIKNQIQDAKNVQPNSQIKFTQQASMQQQIQPPTQIQQRQLQPQQPQLQTQPQQQQQQQQQQPQSQQQQQPQQQQQQQPQQPQKKIHNPFQILAQNNRMEWQQQQIVQQNQQSSHQNNFNYPQVQVQAQSQSQSIQRQQFNQQALPNQLNQNQQQAPAYNSPRPQPQQQFQQPSQQQQRINAVQQFSQKQVTQMNYNYTVSSNNNQNNIRSSNNNQVVSYPPPNQVTNFERKIQINDSKHRANPQITQYSQIIQHNQIVTQQPTNRTNDLYDEKIIQQEPKIKINQIKNDQSDNDDNAIANSQVRAVDTTSTDKRQSKIITRAETFGVAGSFGTISDIGGTVNQTIKLDQGEKNNYYYDSPMFGKGKQSKVSQRNSQVNQNKRETHIDQLLALEEQKLYMIKSKQSGANQKSIASSMVKKQSVIQINNEGQSNKTLIINNNKSMTNSKKQNKKSEQENIFKKAIKETASNIRLETSKVSIRSSSDLKGIISYKDLRDLLKSTKKPIN